ncbi:hypothetical protein CLV88_1238 [Shimia abyssi]|uniref:Uncharacterized protein n=1 Tax=Shimia abyssi TaxID=1662395 RepID=A0A2P8F2U1_9RHOB|nr:hypothetical protein CLV88_1238 [Shimia abyssi]
MFRVLPPLGDNIRDRNHLGFLPDGIGNDLTRETEALEPRNVGRSFYCRWLAETKLASNLAMPLNLV